MVFPEEVYTRYRQNNTQLGASLSDASVKTYYSGTVSDPWRITSTVNEGGSFINNELETMYDVEDPEWRKRWQRHGIATVNPMEYTSTSFNRGVGNFHVRRINRYGTSPNYYYSGSQNLGTVRCGDSDASSAWNYPAVPAIDDSIIAEAITEAWSKVSLTDTLALATAAEMSKTLEFLISIFRRAWKIFRALKKFDVKALKGELNPKELAQRYMEARYALRPLMYEVRNTLEAVADKAPLRYSTFRAFKADLAIVTTPNFDARTVANDYSLTGTAQANRSLEVRSGVLAFVKRFGALERFGTADILQTAWELIPFSFIVDWFFQVGKLVSAWSPKIGLETLASWYVVDDTTILSVTIETSTSLATGYNYTNFYNRSGSYSKVIRSKYRVPNPDRPVLPSFNLKLNKLKLLDLGIIATGLYNAWFNRKGVKSPAKTNYGYAWFDD